MRNTTNYKGLNNNFNVIDKYLADLNTYVDKKREERRLENEKLEGFNSYIEAGQEINFQISQLIGELYKHTNIEKQMLAFFDINNYIEQANNNLNYFDLKLETFDTFKYYYKIINGLRKKLNHNSQLKYYDDKISNLNNQIRELNDTYNNIKLFQSTSEINSILAIIYNKKGIQIWPKNIYAEKFQEELNKLACLNRELYELLNDIKELEDKIKKVKNHSKYKKFLEACKIYHDDGTSNIPYTSLIECDISVLDNIPTMGMFLLPIDDANIRNDIINLNKAYVDGQKELEEDKEKVKKLETEIKKKSENFKIYLDNVLTLISEEIVEKEKQEQALINEKDQFKEDSISSDNDIKNKIQSIINNRAILFKRILSELTEKYENLYSDYNECIKNANNNNTEIEIQEYLKSLKEILFTDENVKKLIKYNSIYRESSYDEQLNKKQYSVPIFYYLIDSSFDMNKSNNKSFISNFLQNFCNIAKYNDHYIKYSIPFLFNTNKPCKFLVKSYKLEAQIIAALLNGLPAGKVRFIIIDNIQININDNFGQFKEMNSIDGFDNTIFYWPVDNEDTVNTLNDKVLYCKQNINLGVTTLKSEFIFILVSKNNMNEAIKEKVTYLANNGYNYGIYVIFHDCGNDVLFDEESVIITNNSIDTSDGLSYRIDNDKNYNINDEFMNNLLSNYQKRLVDNFSISIYESVPIETTCNYTKNSLFFDDHCVHYYVAGDPGVGKSSLLNLIVSNILDSNKNIELYLADLKNGLSFSHFLPVKDERLKIICAAPKKRFLLSILKYLKAKIEELNTSFNNSGCSNWKDYNALHDDKIPFRLIIIDDYHVNDRDVLSSIIDEILYKGLTYNIHLILSSHIIEYFPKSNNIQICQGIGKIAFLSHNINYENFLGKEKVNYINKSVCDKRSVYIDNMNNKMPRLALIDEFDKNKIGLSENRKMATEKIPLKVVTMQMDRNPYSFFNTLMKPSIGDIGNMRERIDEKLKIIIPLGNDLEIDEASGYSEVQLHLTTHNKVLYHFHDLNRVKATFQITFYSILYAITKQNEKLSVAIVCDDKYINMLCIEQYQGSGYTVYDLDKLNQIDEEIILVIADRSNDIIYDNSLTVLENRCLFIWINEISESGINPIVNFINEKIQHVVTDCDFKNNDELNKIFKCQNQMLEDLNEAVLIDVSPNSTRSKIVYLYNPLTNDYIQDIQRFLKKIDSEKYN